MQQHLLAGMLLLRDASLGVLLCPMLHDVPMERKALLQIAKNLFSAEIGQIAKQLFSADISEAAKCAAGYRQHSVRS